DSDFVEEAPVADRERFPFDLPRDPFADRRVEIGRFGEFELSLDSGLNDCTRKRMFAGAFEARRPSQEIVLRDSCDGADGRDAWLALRQSAGLVEHPTQFGSI